MTGRVVTGKGMGGLWNPGIGAIESFDVWKVVKPGAEMRMGPTAGCMRMRDAEGPDPPSEPEPPSEPVAPSEDPAG